MTHRETGTPTLHAAREQTACDARFPHPSVAAHDPADPDYTAGDVDELVRWQRRAAGSAPSRTR